MASTRIGKQALVIGAGIGGLTAAGALADHFDQVLILERDTLPSEPTYRAGTPQARHVHGLLLSGQRALSELFPEGSRAGGRRAAQGWSRCSHRTRGLRSLPATRSRLVGLRGVPADDRARRAT